MRTNIRGGTVTDADYKKGHKLKMRENTIPGIINCQTRTKTTTSATKQPTKAQQSGQPDSSWGKGTCLQPEYQG